MMNGGVNWWFLGAHPIIFNSNVCTTSSEILFWKSSTLKRVGGAPKGYQLASLIMNKPNPSPRIEHAWLRQYCHYWFYISDFWQETYITVGSGKLSKMHVLWVESQTVFYLKDGVSNCNWHMFTIGSTYTFFNEPGKRAVNYIKRRRNNVQIEHHNNQQRHHHWPKDRTTPL